MKYRVKLVNPHMSDSHDQAHWFLGDDVGEVILFDSLEEADIAGEAHIDDAACPWDYEVEEAGE